MIITFNQTKVDRIRDRYIKKHYTLILKDLNKQLTSLTTTIDAGIINKAPEVNIDVRGSVFNLYMEVGTRFGNISQDKFNEVLQKKGKNDNLFQKLLNQYYENYVANLVKNVSETVQNEIRGVIEKTLLKDLTIQQTKKELLKGIKNITKQRALVIARTETIRASNAGNLVGAASTGLEFNKIWISHIDSRIRDEHITANGQKVGKNDLFKVGGESLAFPADTSHGASAWNTIQCRCSIGYEPILPEVFDE